MASIFFFDDSPPRPFPSSVRRARPPVFHRPAPHPPGRRGEGGGGRPTEGKEKPKEERRKSQLPQNVDQIHWPTVALMLEILSKRCKNDFVLYVQLSLIILTSTLGWIEIKGEPPLVVITPVNAEHYLLIREFAAKLLWKNRWSN